MLEAFMRNFTVRELSNDISTISIELRKSFKLKVPDAIVYATARDEGCILVSRNTKDFKDDYPDVRVPYVI